MTRTSQNRRTRIVSARFFLVQFSGYSKRKNSNRHNAMAESSSHLVEKGILRKLFSIYIPPSSKERPRPNSLQILGRKQTELYFRELLWLWRILDGFTRKLFRKLGHKFLSQRRSFRDLKGVQPLLALALTSAPWASSDSATSFMPACPRDAAICKGVLPSSFLA
jgi:hypothetical protein